MTSLVASWLAAVVAVTTQTPTGSQEIQVLAAAPRVEDSLVIVVRTRPDDARDALRRLLESAARAPTDSGAAGTFVAARRLADAYLFAWKDSFLVRQVAVFGRWSQDQRAAKTVADSLRRAGNDALPREGVAAALARWRESFHRSLALGDSAGMAATLGNIGAGLYIARDLDSAVTYLEQAQALAEAIDDYRTLGNAVGALASVSKDRGDLARADTLYHRALEVRDRTGDTRGAAADFNNLGLIAQSRGDLDSARTAFEAALALNRRTNRLDPAATNLVNLANVASVAGDYARAAGRYAEALSIKRQLGSRSGVALVLRNLGLLDLRRGDYPQAQAALSEAAAIYREIGPTADAALVERDVATADAAMGDLQAALEDLRGAERLATAKPSTPRLVAQLALARADLAVLFNAADQAEREYTRAERLYSGAHDDAGRAAAGEGQGLLLLWREDYARARSVLARALQIQESLGDQRTAATTRLLVGFAAQRTGDTATARRAFIQALDTLRAVGDPVGEAGALSALGDLEALRGMPVVAESLYHRGLDRLGSRRSPNVSWQLHAALGHALSQQGALPEAASEFRAAITSVEQVSHALPLEERRAAYRADKWEVYQQLALIEHAQHRDGAAFEVSERMRARQTLDLLARGRLAWKPGDTLSALEQDLRYRISEAARGLEVGNSAPSTARALDADDPARERLARAEDAYAELLLAMRERQPEYRSLVSGATASWSAVAARLSPDEALLEYLVTDSTSLLFIGTSDSVTALDLHIGRHRLAALVDFARSALTQRNERVASESWRTPLHRLFEFLVAPAEQAGLLRGKRRLLIAPHGELHYLPFAALVTSTGGNHFLVERYDIAYVPSASVWLRLGERARGPPADQVLAVAPQQSGLPGSKAEVEAIQRLYGSRATVLAGAAATPDSVRRLAPAFSIVHFATHGVLNRHNPLFSYVALSPGRDGGGHLEVHDVFGLSLNARLVVLSACQTGVGSGALADVPNGDDWVGLVEAFHYAGTARVVATLWPVEDRITAEVMERFYHALESGRSEVAALAEAQRLTLGRRESAHPLSWAGFVLSGSD